MKKVIHIYPYGYLENADTMTSSIGLGLPFAVSPLFILHVGMSIRSLAKTEDVRVGVVVQEFQVWL